MKPCFYLVNVIPAYKFKGNLGKLLLFPLVYAFFGVPKVFRSPGPDLNERKYAVISCDNVYLAKDTSIVSL